MLSEEGIVEAALKLAAEAGRLENVSMRALAQELGVPVMTIYNYVANKESLHELVINHVLRPVRVPTPDEGSWEERLRRLERDARRVVGQYPGVAFDGRGGGSAEAARLAEGAMSILASAGFDSRTASLAFATLFTFMLGQIELDAMDVASLSAADLARVSRDTGLSRDEVFEFGFDAVIEGLKAMVARERSNAGVERRRSSR